jgi:putative restriction endonuclease
MRRDLLDDALVRLRAFEFLREQTTAHGDVLPWSVLLRGFEIDGRRVPLVSQQGIFKPAVLEVPLTIRTTPQLEGQPPPYEDKMERDGALLYSYRGTDAHHRENAGLRVAMQRRLPLVYLFGIVEGKYLPVWPVFIVGDDARALKFLVQIEETARAAGPGWMDEVDAVADAAQRPRYAARVTLQRLHQATFRQRVLIAYQQSCAMCHLRRVELLEAAHIVCDRDGGLPIVQNGLALCTLHHAAFDRHVLGVRPDYVIEVRRDVLEDVDGPMLFHGLQALAGESIVLPSAPKLRPRREFLEQRYATFKKTA